MLDGFEPQTSVTSYHPGHPRFVHVGEPIRDPVFVIDADGAGLDVDAHVESNGGRDGLAPRLPELHRNPDRYDAGDFEWSVASSPPDSDGEVLSFATRTTEIPRYDAGLDHVAEFEADAPGRYVVELDAPDGTHELTIHAFPRREGSAPPRIELEGEYDDSTDRFRIDSNAKLATGSDAGRPDLRVEFLSDGRDALATEELEVDEDGLSTTVPVDALEDETARVHAAAFDGRRASVQDSIELHPDGRVTLPNRPPEWAHDAVLYQIFPRSWGGDRNRTTFETLIEGDEETGARGVDYLDELGVDVVWLTPVLPAMSVGVDRPPGGPHGYATLDYFGVSEDLAPAGMDPVDAYRAFVDACNERGIRVCFDLVISHAGLGIEEFAETIAESTGSASTGGRTDRYRILEWDEDARTFDWWDRADVRRYADDGTVVEAAPRSTGFAGHRWMPNWNYENVAMREYILAVVDFWSREIGVDGFRCDIAFGVQHSFWKEVRELVRANDSQFFLLDETIPNDPAFSENEFDAHFDTAGFTETVHELGRRLSPRREGAGYGGERRGPHPDALVERVLGRREQGHPSYSLLLNSIENHDEHRLLNTIAVDPAHPDHEDVTEADWERTAELQRAAFAACVTLPGIPTVYYGAERQISRYGTGRVDDATDHRGQTADGEITPNADVRPGGRQRAFMNWEPHDESHLAFYERMIELYHGLDALHADAALEHLELETEAEATTFLREAGKNSGIEGPETVLVALNFSAEAIEIHLPDGAVPTNLAEEATEEGSTVIVDTVGVFPVETPVVDCPTVRIAD